ncbi:unnamed protein product, partial [Onchocerca ochengi]|uniref:Uncharacterized protein n=1 Tax=Onchocerca ochengi TaxID=42157 RepID=A0A182EFZ1_ONCOC
MDALCFISGISTRTKTGCWYKKGRWKMKRTDSYCKQSLVQEKQP